MNDKQRVAHHAARQIQDGMIVGLGTGSTADCFIEALADRCRREGLRITTVASSLVSTLKAQTLGLPLTAMEHLKGLDVYVDGADEIAPDLTLLKGRGQDLVREKILAQASAQFWVLVDPSKLVGHIGERFPVPVEVTPSAWQLVKARLEAAGAHPALRLKDGGVAVTSSGGVVLDTRFDGAFDPAAVDRLLNDLSGILEHGIFHGLTTAAFIGTDGRVEERRPA